MSKQNVHHAFGVDNAFAFIGNGKGDVSPQQLGDVAGQELLSKYRELLAVLPSIQEVSSRILSWTRINAPEEPIESIQGIISYGELALLELIERGVLPIVVETPEATADLQKLRAVVARSGLRPAPVAPSTAAVQEPVAVDPVDECAADYRRLCGSDFKSKWMKPSTQAIFERACVSGRI